jgi:DNA adenine methylase
LDALSGAGEIEALNDLNGDIVNLFMTVRDHPIELLEGIYLLPYARQLFEEWSDQILKTAEPPDRIERAARFYYCLCSGFAGRGPGAGWAFERSHIRHQPLTWWNRATHIPLIHERLRSVHIDHLDFRRFIANWDAPENFLYCDPPYLETADYKSVPTFTESDHRDLAKLLTNAKAKWLVTTGDHPLMRELYAVFRIETVETQLAVEKVEGEGTRGVLRHLIITNYDPARMQAFTSLKQTTLSME